MNLIEYLNQNSGALNAIFSGVVAVSTAVYAILTWRLVHETKKMRDIQNEPKVIVMYKSRDEWAPLLDILIKNIGLGPALDLRFQLGASTNGTGTSTLMDELQQLNFLQKGLSFLGPGDSVRSFFTNVNQDFQSKMMAKIDVEVTYRNATGVRYKNQYVIDLSELKGLRQLGVPPLEKVARSVEKIERNVNSLITGFNRIRVDMFDAKDRSREAKAIESRYRGTKANSGKRGIRKGS